MSAKPTKQDRVTVRFDAETLGLLEAMAADRGMPVAGVVRAACDLYLKDQKLGAELEGVEGRLAGSILRTQNDMEAMGKRLSKAVYKAAEDVQLTIALFDQLAKFFFYSTPEVIDREGMAALGHKRYARFMAELHTAFYTRRRKAALAENLESINEGTSGDKAGEDGPDWIMSDDEDLDAPWETEQSTTSQRTRLDVPFSEKDAAMKAGAKWDSEAKSFYAPPGVDMSELQRWLPAPI